MKRFVLGPSEPGLGRNAVEKEKGSPGDPAVHMLGGPVALRPSLAVWFALIESNIVWFIFD